MKRFIVAVVMGAAVVGVVSAQENAPAREREQGEAGRVGGLPYTEGSVAVLTFVRTKPGMTDDYVRNLAVNWQRVMEHAKGEGLILSYKVFLGSAANRADWDIMLMVEYKNMAALDGNDAKFQAIEDRLLGSQAQQHQGSEKRNEIREILGEKIVRQITLRQTTALEPSR